MDLSYWQKQSSDTPLFPDILWSRPETKHTAGKLTIIGGNGFGFGAPGIAYNSAIAAGIGVCRVVLPDAVKKTVKLLLPDADFAPSTPSGSFAKKALSDLLAMATWADGCLLAGDFGRNSETAVVLEQFVKKYSGLLVVTQDAIDYFKSTPRMLLEREQTVIVLSLAQLQKYFIHIPLLAPITYGMSALQLAEALRELTLQFPAYCVVKHHEQLFVAGEGNVVTQPHETESWRVITATKAAVIGLQQPQQLFKAIVSSLTI